MITGKLKLLIAAILVLVLAFGMAGQALAKLPTHTDLNIAGGVSSVDYTTDYMDDLITVGLNTSSTGPQVAIYTGPGVWDEGVIALENFLDFKGLDWEEVNAWDVNRKDLSALYDAIIIPGGWAVSYKRYISDSGIQHIKELVNNGGAYIGICAGAYYAADKVAWEGRTYDYPLDLFNGTAYGSLDSIIPWDGYTMTILNMNLDDSINIYEPATEDMLFFGGPALYPNEGENVDVVARWAAHNNDPAIVKFNYNQGRVLLLGPHPEIEEDSDRDGTDFADEFEDNGSDWPFLWAAMDWVLQQPITEPPSGQPEIPNTPPVAYDQTVGTDEDTPVATTLTGSDPDGDPLTFSVVTSPANGALSGTPPNLTYSPDPDYNGADSFTFRANDGKADSNVATVSITVNPMNDPPVAYDQAITTSVGNSVYITVTASDVDGDLLTFSVVDGPINGALTGGGINLTYTPNPGYIGSDSFTFKVNDGNEYSNIATVTIIVNPGDPPEEVVLYDSFEDVALDKWLQDTQNDWFVSTQRAKESSYSAEVDGRATDATLTMAGAVDLSAKASATLSFSWFIERSWDAGEYIRLDMFYHGAWHEDVFSINGARRLGPEEDRWIDISIDLDENYFGGSMPGDFKIQFRAKVSSFREDGHVDDVKIVARG